MTPQLFINYKLKSVANLPWRALTYKVIYFSVGYGFNVQLLLEIIIDVILIDEGMCNDLYVYWYYTKFHNR